MRTLPQKIESGILARRRVQDFDVSKERDHGGFFVPLHCCDAGTSTIMRRSGQRLLDNKEWRKRKCVVRAYFLNVAKDQGSAALLKVSETLIVLSNPELRIRETDRHTESGQ